MCCGHEEITCVIDYAIIDPLKLESGDLQVSLHCLFFLYLIYFGKGQYLSFDVYVEFKDLDSESAHHFSLHSFWVVCCQLRSMVIPVALFLKFLI